MTAGTGGPGGGRTTSISCRSSSSSSRTNRSTSNQPRDVEIPAERCSEEKKRYRALEYTFSHTLLLFPSLFSLLYILYMYTVVVVVLLLLLPTPPTPHHPPSSPYNPPPLITLTTAIAATTNSHSFYFYYSSLFILYTSISTLIPFLYFNSSSEILTKISCRATFTGAFLSNATIYIYIYNS